ncbi:hypothetical protein [Fusibacter sp. JL216-2]|uniref:hypothetical protein n=1 Tax=Fusibacter sp. JL216-2 TaxID=3071453 RepID=UPI003D353F73
MNSFKKRISVTIGALALACILNPLTFGENIDQESYLSNEEETTGLMVFEKEDEFIAVDTVEFEGRVYLELTNILKAMNIEIEKAGKIYRVVDSTEENHEEISTYSDEAVFIGTYNDDGTYKQGQVFWLSGKAYNGTFKNNLPSGQGEMIFENGDVYKGSFDKGLPHGQGQLFYKDGSNYLGQMRYGTVTGYGRIRYANNDVYKGYLYMGIFHGAGAFSEHDGGTKQGLWEYGTYIKYLSDKDMDLYMFDK